MKPPKISVLMSVYNGEKYLHEAIDSILNQTIKDFEFLIINDGSTDRTGKILLSYDDPRVQIIQNDSNIGLAKSLNKGLLISKGEYIARMDADDISLPHRLEKESDFLDRNKDVGVVGCFALHIDESGTIIKHLQRKIDSHTIKNALLKEHNQFWHGSVMFKKECTEKVGGYRDEFKASQDYDLWLRIADHYELANIPEALYQMRFHPNSISIKKRVEQGHYVELAKKLAAERIQTGRDALQRGNVDEINKIVASIPSKSWIKQRKDLAYGYYKWANMLFHRNRLKDCRKFSAKILWLYPFHYSAWRLLILSTLPAGIISGIKSVKGYIHGK